MAQAGLPPKVLRMYSGSKVHAKLKTIFISANEAVFLPRFPLVITKPLPASSICLSSEMDDRVPAKTIRKSDRPVIPDDVRSRE
jgi:hypothetical protein